MHLDGTTLSLTWVIPFMCILGAIAFAPLRFPSLWRRHYGKVSFLCGASIVVPMLWVYGVAVTGYEMIHMLALEYLPFIILLLALFTISGGICITGTLRGSPKLNLVMIGFGTLLASWIGTTGAAMLLIRPLIRANKWRRHKAHIVVFFIFLVANIGGALTPLGDPPLFLGFLNGVSFFWTTTQLFLPMLVMAVPLLVIFYVLDTYFYRKDLPNKPKEATGETLGLKGGLNFVWLAAVVLAVLLSGVWDPGITLHIYHVPVTLQSFSRDLILLGLTYTSWRCTGRDIRTLNDYTWHPIVEVAKLFLGIFVTIIPVLSMLKAETQPLVQFLVRILYTDVGEPINSVVFWVTGLHSSILDNAPSYLIFFNALGGDAQVLMTKLSGSLLAISAGAVFMGAMTYIGNGPNFMVKSIAEDMGVDMPSFMGYIGRYVIPFLVPLLVVVTWLFF